MRYWHYQRCKIPFDVENPPRQAQAGNWIFFWILMRHGGPVFRWSHVPMTTLGLDGVE